MPLFRRKDQSQRPPAEASLPQTSLPETGAPVIDAFGRELAAALPEDKRSQVALPLTDPVAIGGGLDDARAYRILDWLIRTWLPAWLPGGDPDRERVVSMLMEHPPIRDLESAASAGVIVSTFAAWDSAAKDQAASMNTKFLGDIAVEAADMRAAEAVRITGGEAAAAAVQLAEPDAARAALADDALAAARAIAWSRGADSAIDAIVAMATAPDPDIRRIVARNVSPAAAWNALRPTEAELQDSAIDLYRELATM